jgi:hypothetical protein
MQPFAPRGDFAFAANHCRIPSRALRSQRLRPAPRAHPPDDFSGDLTMFRGRQSKRRLNDSVNFNADLTSCITPAFRTHPVWIALISGRFATQLSRSGSGDDRDLIRLREKA